VFVFICIFICACWFVVVAAEDTSCMAIDIADDARRRRANLLDAAMIINMMDDVIITRKDSELILIK